MGRGSKWEEGERDEQTGESRSSKRRYREVWGWRGGGGAGLAKIKIKHNRF